MFSPLDRALQVEAVEGEVVLTSPPGHGRTIGVSMTPEAVLASVQQMRSTAEVAIRQRDGSAAETTA